MFSLIHFVSAPYGSDQLFLPRARSRSYGNKALLPLPVGVPTDWEGEGGLDPVAINQGEGARLRGRAHRRGIAYPLRPPNYVLQDPTTGLHYQAIGGRCRRPVFQGCATPA